MFRDTKVPLVLQATDELIPFLRFVLSTSCAHVQLPSFWGGGTRDQLAAGRDRMTQDVTRRERLPPGGTDWASRTHATHNEGTKVAEMAHHKNGLTTPLALWGEAVLCSAVLCCDVLCCAVL